VFNGIQGKWNDDIAWWGMAALSGAKAFGKDAKVDPNQPSGTWLQIADNTLNDMFEQLDTTKCGGELDSFLYSNASPL
jgi:mannan endo-1,6-alpha-mannosidase